MKIKKNIFVPVLVLLCIILYALFVIPTIERRTWVLSYAQQTEAPYFVVAHGKDYDVSNIEDSIFKFSTQIDLICEAKHGRLLFTDKTNGKTYEGSYKITSVGGGKFRSFNGATYTVVIDGLEGIAKINSDFDRKLFVYIDGYCLNFDVE